MNIEVSSFSDISVEWSSHDPIIKKRSFVICKIFMLHFIRNFENSLIISSKNVSLIFQFDLCRPNKLISFIFNRSLCIERNHSRKDRAYSILHASILNWVNQMTALLQRRSCSNYQFLCSFSRIDQTFSYRQTIIINTCCSLFCKIFLKTNWYLLTKFH